jgi:hypothetical protein
MILQMDMEFQWQIEEMKVMAILEDGPSISPVLKTIDISDRAGPIVAGVVHSLVA